MLGKHIHQWTQANNQTHIHIFSSENFLLILMAMGVFSGGFKYIFELQRQFNNEEVGREWTCWNMKKMH